VKIRESLTQWDNFAIPELKEILEHCEALESIGIAQDEEIVHEIERDITLREQRKKGYLHQAKIVRKPAENPEKDQLYLLEQTA
jgi:hypothetical protein